MKLLSVIAVLSATLVAGCMQQTVRSDVTRFHVLPPAGAERTFIVLPLEGQESSLEFQQHAGSVATKLVQLGYRETTDFTSADYALFVEYGVGDPQSVTRSMPVWGQTGGGTTYHTGSLSSYGGGGYGHGTYSGTSYTAPTYGVVGTETYSDTVYTRVLFVDLVDLHESTEANLKKAFEARVISAGSIGTFSQVSECMISALFKDFPGTSGETTSVTIDSSTCVK